MPKHAQPPVFSLLRFGLNSPDSMRLVEFYQRALSARIESRVRQESSDLKNWPPGIHGGANRTMLRLGSSTIEIVEFDRPGDEYPDKLAPYDVRFQHFGIVVTDMRRAMQCLSQVRGWSAISTHGPQTLSANAGAVTAFKFCDPDGHPLEFLQFAPGKIPAHWQHSRSAEIFSGIDHSAVSIADVARSTDFYESLGLTVSSRTLNRGIAQARLDGLSDPSVDVIGLAPASATPHVELLHYRTAVRATGAASAYNDTAATRLIFATQPNVDGFNGKVLTDPDGHFIEVLD